MYILCAMDMSPATGLVEHPDHGLIPAIKTLECIFALAPGGRILHFHIEQFDRQQRDDGIYFVFNQKPPAEQRGRCQIIPPLVAAFGNRS